MTSNLLLKARPSAATDWRECIEELARSLKVSINACFEAVIDREIYAYLSATEDGVAIARRIEPMVAERLGDPTASALSQLLRVPGPAYGLSAPFHYVVETDVEPEHEAEAQAERAQAAALAGGGLAGHVGHVARDQGQHAG